MDPQKAQLNARIPKELRDQARMAAMREGIPFEKWVERVIRAAVESEALAHDQPTFLRAWERFLSSISERKR